MVTLVETLKRLTRHLSEPTADIMKVFTAPACVPTDRETLIDIRIFSDWVWVFDVAVHVQQDPRASQAGTQRAPHRYFYRQGACLRSAVRNVIQLFALILTCLKGCIISHSKF